MSSHAIYRGSESGEEKYILARNCSSVDYGLPFFCPSCRAPVTLRRSRKGNYFFGGTHNEGCDIASFSKGKTIILPSGYQVPLDTILGADDRPIVPLRLPLLLGRMAKRSRIASRSPMMARRFFSAWDL